MTTDSSFTSDISPQYLLFSHEDVTPSYSYDNDTLTINYATHRLCHVQRLVARYSPKYVVLQDTLVPIETWCQFILDLPPICLTCKLSDQFVTYSRSDEFITVSVALSGDDEDDEDFMEQLFNAITYTTWPTTWTFDFICVGNDDLEEDLKKLARKIASQFLICHVKCVPTPK